MTGAPERPEGAAPEVGVPPGPNNRRLVRYVAGRYLRGAGGRGLMSFITMIAVGGVAVGVMALIVVIGILNGLQESLREKILAGGPHAGVLQQDNELRMEGWRRVIEQVREDPDVVAAAPFVYTQVLLNAGDVFNVSAVMRGISDDPDANQVSGLLDALVLGHSPFEPSESGEAGIVVGSGIARRLGLYMGKLVTAASLANTPMTAGGISPALRRFEVVGVFQTGLYQYDDELVVVTLEDAQALLGLDEMDAVTGVEFDVVDPWNVGDATHRVEEALGFPYKVDDWRELNGSLFSALALEKLGMFVVLTLIVLVASFNIVSTLVMMVGDKTREIGILRSMGVTATTIGRIFRTMGLFIGIVGTLIGGTLGAILAWVLTTYQFIDLPTDVYFLDKLPMSLAPTDVALIVVGSVTISWLATLYPARKAAALQPVEAIRHE